MEPLIRKILVPTDFSESAARGVTYGAALARRLGASLHLVHVIEAEALAHGAFEADAGESRAPGTRLYQEARRTLAAEADRLNGARGRPLSISTEVRGGVPAKAISDAIIDFGADIVVMATHGRTGLSHLLMGSVAEQVIRLSRSPVLIVRECGQAHVHRPRQVETAQLA
jgi:nucleotide-binding universal stress UspA family protein